MGGKNPTIVTANADLDKAALGVMRSAFGLTGQKCSACSRVFVESSVKEAFLDKLVDLTADINVGDPTQQDTYMGPIISADAYAAYQRYVDELRAGDIRTGGRTLEQGRGYFVAPTVVTDLPDDHRLWQHEMFAPIVAVRAVDNKDEAMQLANDVALGLTAGLYSEDPNEAGLVPGQYAKPACSTSIAKPAPPPAPGPVISPSAAGRAAPAATRPPAAMVLPAAVHARAVAHDCGLSTHQDRRGESVNCPHLHHPSCRHDSMNRPCLASCTPFSAPSVLNSFTFC